MFCPEPMLRLSIVVLERDERVLLRELGRLGAVQLMRGRAGPDTAPLNPRDRTAELARSDRLLARIEELRDSLGIEAAAEGPAEPRDMTLDQAEEKLRTLGEAAGSVLQRRQHLQQRWNDLASMSEQLSSYRGTGLPLDQPGESTFLHFVTGTLAEEGLAKLRSEVGENVVLLPMPKQNGRHPLIAITSSRGRLALETALKQASFRPEALPAIRGATADSVSDESRRDQAEVARDLERANAEWQPFVVAAAGSLAAIERLIRVERRLLEADQHLARTEAAILLTGWIPASDSAAMQQRVGEVTGGRCAIHLTGPGDVPEEQIPVLLKHPRLLRPFEMLVSAYGLPRYRELEPTVFVAISYVLMFGMMFGDAGQGAVLAIGGLIALIVGRTGPRRDIGLLLLFAGLSSVAFGVVYGSYFGITQLKQYALWHDPLEGNPMGLMSVAVGIGIVMISLGLILNIMNRFRHADIFGGFCDKFGVVGVVFYWGALALLMKYAAIRSRGLVGLAILVFLGLPVTAWALKEPIEYLLCRRAGRHHESGGLFPAFMESVVGAFEGVLLYLANTVSFVRLAAYAMSHAALLMAAFALAAKVAQFHAGGKLLSLLVIIGGNLIAIALEGIIASVQALRLEYYEFFGKFFSGSGRPFQPFCLPAQTHA